MRPREYPGHLQHKCITRVIERETFRELGDEFTVKAAEKAANDRSMILAMIASLETESVHVRIEKALARLPANASWELRRQVIAEEWAA